MARVLKEQEKQRIYDYIREFLAEELDVEIDEIKEDANIIDDLGGDSLLYLEIIEELKKQYDIKVEVRAIGQYMLQKSVNTIQEVLEAIYEIIEKEEQIYDLIQKGDQNTEES